VFPVESVDETLRARCAALEIHPTGPLVGIDEPMSGGEVRALEQSVAAAFPEALTVIRGAQMRGERRALRLRVRDLAHEYAGGVLKMRFMLPSGSFATTVLREIIASVATEE
jgi:tRNA pseudouridine13 synthase